MRKLLRLYLRTSLILRILVSFVVGSLIGVVFWSASDEAQPTGAATPDVTVSERVVPYIFPLGQVFVHMLKMIVVPISVETRLH